MIIRSKYSLRYWLPVGGAHVFLCVSSCGHSGFLREVPEGAREAAIRCHPHYARSGRLELGPDVPAMLACDTREPAYQVEFDYDEGRGEAMCVCTDLGIACGEVVSHPALYRRGVDGCVLLVNDSQP